MNEQTQMTVIGMILKIIVVVLVMAVCRVIHAVLESAFPGKALMILLVIAGLMALACLNMRISARIHSGKEQGNDQDNPG
jgi:cobalamin biosynthesis protein CobD/CbiB